MQARPWHVLQTMILALLLSAARCEPTGPEDRLAAARSRWAQLGIDDYTIVISRSCECLVEMSEPAVVVVRNGRVESRTYLRTGQPVRPEYADGYPSVEELFRKIEQGLATEGRGILSVDYHPLFGYPTRHVFGDAAADAPVTFARDLEHL